ncbi:hypothetical protein RHS02_08757, partial [Rhizoctonia solani]
MWLYVTKNSSAPAASTHRSPTGPPPTKRRKTSLHISATPQLGGPNIEHQSVSPFPSESTPTLGPLPVATDRPRRSSSAFRAQSYPIQSQNSSRNRSMAVTLPVSVARDASERTSSLERVPMQRPDMELALRREINQAVYEYPDFVNE